MAADGPASLTGVHKRLLRDYVVLELVAHAATWAETEGGENYDEEVALEWGVGCARAYASANMTTSIQDAARERTTRASVCQSCPPLEAISTWRDILREQGT